MPASSSERPVRLLRSLNVFGLDHLDPVVLAALADERPLLVVGPHGTAKSELLNRLARVLKLDHRHFNASLISFDDLLGYPVPDVDRKGLTYLRTDGDLWGAESVFLDEISRCRPETQNKLFSIVHERRVQGLPLERLRYRWAAMNPPADGDDFAEDEQYLGSLPLDPALADRFPWVVVVPRIGELGAEDRRLLLRRGGEEPRPDVPVAELVERARALLGAAPPRDEDWIVAYVGALIAPLHEAGLPISGRRGVQLCGSIRAVHAACRALGRDVTLADAALLALRWGIPQRASGRRVEETAIAGAHRLAERAAGLPPDSPWRLVTAETDPVRRLAVALAQPVAEFGAFETTQLVADALASLTAPERHALAFAMLPTLSGSDRLAATGFEALADLVAPVLNFLLKGEHTLNEPRSREPQWVGVLGTVTRLQERGGPGVDDAGNLLCALVELGLDDIDHESVATRFLEWRALFDALRAVAA